MGIVKTVVNLCTATLNISINLFGFDISLMQLLIYSVIAFILSYLLFGLFK